MIVGRSPQKTAAVAQQIGAPYHLADFGQLAQVRRLADELLGAYPRIDVLANNAGGLFRQETTIDGYDKTFQVNHLAPFLLTSLLMDALLAAGASVIQTSSAGARILGHIDINDLNNTRKWTANKAYGDAKLANILFTKQLHHRYHDQGINAVAFHPGSVATNFANDTASPIRFAYQTALGKLMMISPDKGGQALSWLVEGIPGSTWKSGEYYEKNKPAKKVNPQADDAALARQLWERSKQMIAAVPG